MPTSGPHQAHIKGQSGDDVGSCGSDTPALLGRGPLSAVRALRRAQRGPARTKLGGLSEFSRRFDCHKASIFGIIKHNPLDPREVLARNSLCALQMRTQADWHAGDAVVLHAGKDMDKAVDIFRRVTSDYTAMEARAFLRRVQ